MDSELFGHIWFQIVKVIAFQIIRPQRHQLTAYAQTSNTRMLCSTQLPPVHSHTAIKRYYRGSGSRHRVAVTCCDWQSHRFQAGALSSCCLSTCSEDSHKRSQHSVPGSTPIGQVDQGRCNRWYRYGDEVVSDDLVVVGILLLVVRLGNWTRRWTLICKLRSGRLDWHRWLEYPSAIPADLLPWQEWFLVVTLPVTCSAL